MAGCSNGSGRLPLLPTAASSWYSPSCAISSNLSPSLHDTQNSIFLCTFSPFINKLYSLKIGNNCLHDLVYVVVNDMPASWPTTWVQLEYNQIKLNKLYKTLPIYLYYIYIKYQASFPYYLLPRSYGCGRWRPTQYPLSCPLIYPVNPRITHA